jgi:8-oxo-dGTP diphosphatase
MIPIPVTCAIIFHQGKVLVAQRSLNMDLPGKWEFPGGKIEESEDPKVCLLREIKEELSIEIEIFETLKPSEFAYPSKTIRLIPFVATWKSGEIDLLEHEQIVWLGEKDLFCVDWAEADVPILHELQEKWVKLIKQIKTAT